MSVAAPPAPPRARADKARRWLLLGLALLLLSAFVAFLTTEPVPPGKAGEIIARNLRQGTQATALFYSDLHAMGDIEDRLLVPVVTP